MTKQLLISDYSFSYGKNVVFENLTFFLLKNSYNVILGSNNSGKTTLIRRLPLLLSKTYDSSDYFIYFSRGKKRNEKGMVFNKLLSSFFNKRCGKKKIDSVVDMFELSTILYKKISGLSDFDYLRVQLACVFLSGSKFILLDDIYDDISFDDALMLISIFNKLCNENNITIVVTTSKLDNCITCDNVVFLNDKKVELQGDFDYLLNYDNVLARNGIIISTMLDLSLKLKMYNLIQEIVFDPGKLVDVLWR